MKEKKVLRYSKEEREALNNRILELLKEKVEYPKMRDILHYEGYRRANGQELNVPTVYQRALGLKRRARAKKYGPVQEIYKAQKTPVEQKPGRVEPVQDETTYLVSTLKKLASNMESDTELGSCVRALLK